jgi:hypothetical protein
MTRERSKEQIPIRRRKSRNERQVANAPFSLQRWLFDLFRILSIEQKTIAAHLSVSRTMVSFWANDREPISRHYLEMLHELVFATLVENYKQERLFNIELATLRKKTNPDEIRKILAQDKKDRGDSLRQLLFGGDEELIRKHEFYFERDKQLHEMRIELSSAASALCEKVAKEHREVSDFIERNPERPLQKMLRISRETRDSIKNGCCSVLTDVEQIDNLLWFEEALIQASSVPAAEQPLKEVRTPTTH